MSADVPKFIELPSGAKYPVVGLGTFTIFNAAGEPGAVFEAVKYAIDIGYRSIDCAFVYQNEGEVGDAIQAKLDDGTIKNKKDIFITTKLWDTHHNPTQVKEGAMKSLQALKVDSVQLYLMHWPFGFKDGDDCFPKDKDGNIVFSDHDYIDTWKAMEQLVDERIVENIGISNFNKNQIERLLQNARIKPCNLQVEVHPYFSNRKLVEYSQSKGMCVTAYAPLANVGRTWKGENDPSIFEEPILKKIASSKGKTIAQVVLRFLLQRNIIVIPKSVTPSRIKENFDLFNFSLSDEEMDQIYSLDRNTRYYVEPIARSHKYFPFNDEY